jgi:hypothetical protein
MPLPTIANVFRVRLLWSAHAGVTPVNVFHVRASGADEEDIFNQVEGELLGNQFGCMNQNYTINAIGVTPLDGASAETVFTLGTPLAATGGTGEQSPQVAVVVSLHTTQRGARGRGRLYLGPVVEVSQVNGALDSGDRTAMQTAWESFVSGLAGGAIATLLGVASYTHSDFHDLKSLSVQSVLGTQRRRQDQLR